MMFSRITKRPKIGRMIGKNAVMKVLLNRDTFVSLWRTPQPQVRVLLLLLLLLIVKIFQRKVT